MRSDADVLASVPIFAAAEGSEAKEEIPPEESGGETGKAIRALFQRYVTAFEAKDIDGVMAAFANEPNTVLMGTGPDEIWLGKENIRFAHLAFMDTPEKETSKERTLVSAGSHDNMAWVMGFVEVNQKLADGENTFQVNLSMVLEKIEGEWYICSMHFSNLTGA